MALAQGESVAKVALRLGVAEQTYYRWRREYGGLRLVADQALEQENARLKRLVADQALDHDHAILKEVASGNF